MGERQEREGELHDIEAFELEGVEASPPDTEKAKEDKLSEADAFAFEEIESDLKKVEEKVPVAEPVFEATPIEENKPIIKKLPVKFSKPVEKSASAVKVQDIQKAAEPSKSRLLYILVILVLLGGGGAFFYFGYFVKTESQPSTVETADQSGVSLFNNADELCLYVKDIYGKIKSEQGIADEEIIKRTNECLGFVTLAKEKYNSAFDKCSEDIQDEIRKRFIELAKIEGFFRGKIIPKSKKVEEPEVAEATPLPTQKQEEPVAEEIIQPQEQVVEQNVEEVKPAEEPPVVVEEPVQDVQPQADQPAQEVQPQVEEKLIADDKPQEGLAEGDMLAQANKAVFEVVTGVKRLKPSYSNLPNDSEALATLRDNTAELIKNLDKSRDTLTQIREKHADDASYGYIDDKLKQMEVVRKYLIKQSEKIMSMLK